MILLCLFRAAFALAQTASVTRNVNLRPDPSTNLPPIRRLGPGDVLELLSATPQSGYYHVRTADGQEGWVWARSVRVRPAAGSPPGARVGPGSRGMPSQTGCGDGLWLHVYHPNRLLVKQNCLTVTGVIVDATAGQAIRQPDGVRHEPDGDTHGWLKVDPAFQSLIAPRNVSNEGGNLIFEIVCHFSVTQADAKPACVGFHDSARIPPAGSHVAITGSIVEDTIHGWNEIHPVSSIKVQ